MYVRYFSPLSYTCQRTIVGHTLLAGNGDIRNMRLKLLAAAAISAAMYAAPITIFSTGAGLSNPSVDPNWTMISGPLGAGSLTVIPDLGPIFAYWTNNGPGAKWITPSGNALDNYPVGTYTFRTSFDLTGLVASTGSLSGVYYVDNTVTDILLNGVSLGISGGGFKDPTNFIINCGANCNSGVNNLDFVIANTSVFATPMGLRVDISGTADAAPPLGAPEPSSIAMLSAGCALFLISRVGKRKA